MGKYILDIRKSKQERFDEINDTLTKNTLHYKKLLYELVEVTNDIQETKGLSDYHCQKLWEGMLQSWDYVWYSHSGCYVNCMTNHFKECKDMLLNLWHSKDAKLRQRAICILDGNTSIDVREQIIAESKKDRSKWVRSSIVGFIMTYDLKQYIPELKQRLLEEKDDYVKESLSDAVSIMENGYILRPLDESRYIIEHRIKNGFRGRVIFEKEIEMYTSLEYIEKIYNGQVI